MAQQPFLKSICPVNLLSFGPKTEEIELRPLNILIGPNGCGKSNLIEIIGLLRSLTSKEPWSTILETGGVDEWIWKGMLGADATKGVPPSIHIEYRPSDNNRPRNYTIEFTKNPATYSFHVRSESISVEVPQDHSRFTYVNRPPDSPDSAFIYVGTNEMSKAKMLDIKQSLLAQLVDPFNYQELFYLGQKLSMTALYRDWVFGVDAEPRDPQPVGLDSENLEEDARNLAQVLKAWRDRGEQVVFDRLRNLMQQFYDPVKDIDAELVGTHIRVVIKESSGINTPAIRLSDGTLRWLTLLIILLNPTPPPITCIEEPELGLHPDIIPTLADLLRDASTRTQLILTTHSQSLVECFSDDPESVCVCEKIDGATRIQRLNKERLSSWLVDYSLGQLWAKGEIGGNRW
jgi:predicted ATPase